MEPSQSTGNLSGRQDLATLKFFQDANHKQVLVPGHLHTGSLWVNYKPQPGVDLS